MPEWRLINGTVSQVVTEGMMVKVNGATEDVSFVLIRNHPDQSKMYDGARFGAVVFPSTPFQYESVGAGLKTVKSFDYGKLPSKERLREITREDEVKRKALAAQQAAEAKARKEAHEKAVRDSKAKLDELRKRNK